MIELWRNIDGYKSVYQVSSFGRIRSFKRGKAVILKQRINAGGYFYVNLCENAIYRSFSVHTLVARAFLGMSTLTVNHKNGNKLNNSVENLEWCTSKENTDHAVENKLMLSGVKNPGHKLTERDVDLIRYKHKKGKKIAFISREFGVSRWTVSDIVYRRSWK